MLKRYNKEWLFWGMSLLFILICFPLDSLSSLAIIIFGTIWLFGGNWTNKYQLLKSRFWYVVVVSIPFVSSLMVFLIRGDAESAMNLNKKVPLLVLAVIVCSIEIKRKDVLKFLEILCLSVIVSSMLALVKWSYFLWNNFGGELYYNSFGKFLEKQPTYYSFFVVVCLIFLLYDLFIAKTWNKWLNVLVQLFFIWLIYILSVRISVMAYLVCSVFLIISYKKKISLSLSKLMAIILGVVVVTGSLYMSKNFKQRFFSIQQVDGKYAEIDVRLIHWKSVIETVFERNIWIGSLDNNGSNDLYASYLKNDFKNGVENKYNAHNQFLEEWLNFGLVGLFSIVIFICIPIYYSLKKRDFLALSIILIIALYMFTESFLQRLVGINMAATLIPSLLSSIDKECEVDGK